MGNVDRALAENTESWVCQYLVYFQATFFSTRGSILFMAVYKCSCILYPLVEYDGNINILSGYHIINQTFLWRSSAKPILDFTATFYCDESYLDSMSWFLQTDVLNFDSEFRKILWHTKVVFWHQVG